MKSEFDISPVGELKFFLGFQVKQMKDGIFLSKAKYSKEWARKFGLENTKPTHTPVSTTLKLHQDPFGKEVK